MKAGGGIRDEHSRRIGKLSLGSATLLGAGLFIFLMFRTQFELPFIIFLCFISWWVGLIFSGLLFSLILRNHKG
jgi:hypothetical protein